jgi:hypothetical protein
MFKSLSNLSLSLKEGLVALNINSAIAQCYLILVTQGFTYVSWSALYTSLSLIFSFLSFNFFAFFQLYHNITIYALVSSYYYSCCQKKKLLLLFIYIYDDRKQLFLF